MKYKTLRYKTGHKEFIHVKEYCGQINVFTCELPLLLPETSSLQGIKDSMSEQGLSLCDGYNQMCWDDIEMIELNLINGDEVGADIRNKLSPAKNIVAMIELYLTEEDEDSAKKLAELILSQVETTNKTIDYLANLI